MSLFDKERFMKRPHGYEDPGKRATVDTQR